MLPTLIQDKQSPGTFTLAVTGPFDIDTVKCLMGTVNSQPVATDDGPRPRGTMRLVDYRWDATSPNDGNGILTFFHNADGWQSSWRPTLYAWDRDAAPGNGGESGFDLLVPCDRATVHVKRLSADELAVFNADAAERRGRG
jgi:hypothetical protein